MATELVVINKKNVIMAADGIMTNRKGIAYDGVEKIFELSNDPAMGVMIYGSDEFNGVPMKTLIDVYRDKCDFSDKENIMDVKDDLLDFIANNVPTTDFKHLMDSRIGIFKKVTSIQIKDLTQERLIDFLKSETDFELPSFLDNFRDIIDEYDTCFDELVPDYVEESQKADVASYIKKMFLYHVLDMGAGIVIAGYNDDDLYASVLNLTLSINYYDEAEKTNKIGIIDYNEMLNIEESVIIPFSNTRVIESILNGIDPKMEKEIVFAFKMILKDSMNDFIETIEGQEGFEDISKLFADFNFDKMVDGYVEEFKNMISIFKKYHLKYYLDLIGIMPKEDVISFASLSVALSPFRQNNDRVEIFGFDVDVASMSKSDGFIWEKTIDEVFNESYIF